MQKNNENILRNFCHIKSQNISEKNSRKYSEKNLEKNIQEFLTRML